MALDGRQRRFLRGRAHALKPVGQVGKNGLTEEILVHLGRELDAHELIKIKFVDFKDEKREICAEIETRLACDLVGTVGHVAILFRPALDPERRRIELP